MAVPEGIREPVSAEEEWLEMINDRLLGGEPSEDQPRKPVSAIEQWLEAIYGNMGGGGGGGTGKDGITPVVTITPISGGHNVAFFYKAGDSRNTNFDVMDGVDGTNGTDGTDGTDGYTPVRGTDYWTASDVSTMEAYCANYIDQEIGVVLNAGY